MAEKRQFIIHFVGHDNVGKTSIARELSYRLKIPYFSNPTNADYHVNNPVANMAKLHAEGLLEYSLLNQIGFSMIRDRNYVCERVYATLYQRETDVEFINELHKAYCIFPDFYIIYCHKDKFREKFEDEYVKEEEVFGLKMLYEATLKLLPCQEKIMWLDTTDENIELQIKKIKDFIEWEKK